MKPRFKPYTKNELEKKQTSFVCFGNPRGNWKDHLSKETLDQIQQGKEISLDELNSMRGNSYDWKTRYPLLSTQALIKTIENNITNCTSVNRTGRYSVDRVYEEALVNTLVPVALDRLEQLEKENLELKKKLENK